MVFTPMIQDIRCKVDITVCSVGFQLIFDISNQLTVNGTAVGSSADFPVNGPTHYNSQVTESDTDATPSV